MLLRCQSIDNSTALGEKENIPVNLPGIENITPQRNRAAETSVFSKKSVIYDGNDQGNLVKYRYVTRRKDWKAVINILFKMKEVLNVLSKAVQAVISQIAVRVLQSKRSSQTAAICSSVMLFSEQMTMIVGRSVFLDLICSLPKKIVDK